MTEIGLPDNGRSINSLNSSETVGRIDVSTVGGSTARAGESEIGI